MLNRKKKKVYLLSLSLNEMWSHLTPCTACVEAAPWTEPSLFLWWGVCHLYQLVLRNVVLEINRPAFMSHTQKLIHLSHWLFLDPLYLSKHLRVSPQLFPQIFLFDFPWQQLSAEPDPSTRGRSDWSQKYPGKPDNPPTQSHSSHQLNTLWDILPTTNSVIYIIR